MKYRRITPDITSNKIEESKKFYSDFIGLKLAMDLGWILTFISESNPTAQINILSSNRQNIDNSNVLVSIESSDVDSLYQKAIAEQMEIVYPLKIEKWDVKRFFVKDPNGVTVNILSHINEPIKTEDLVRDWFSKWEEGDFLNIPVSENFKHTSPFGTIEGKENYLNVVKENKDKFLGYTFDVQDEIYDNQKACVRYRAVQNEFGLDVSEWFYVENNLIKEIVSYYHIGEIQEQRKLNRDG